jgi:aminomethyltransferase
MANETALKTPLFDRHKARGGRIVEFGGWLMPVLYTSIVEEHLAVRQRVGLFDISHMGRLTFDGADALPWLEHVTTNQVERLAENQIQYSLMANGGGGLIDDVLVYRTPHGLLMVCNASNRAHVLAQFERHLEGRSARLTDRTTDTAMIAVQGPKALETLQPLVNVSLTPIKYYHLVLGRVLGDVEAVISRTGYTGEDGFELIVGAVAAERVWDALLDAGQSHGILPCGLGARDTLRFEAAMPLYGHELNDVTNPYAVGLGWAVKLDKGDFIGRDALVAARDNPGRRRIGLRLGGKRIARQGAEVLQGDRIVGQVTSGTFAPTLALSLAMALVDPECSADDTALEIDVRGHREAARVVPLPFYRRPAPAKP